MAKGADCKSAGLRLRRFESYLPHHPCRRGTRNDVGEEWPEKQANGGRTRCVSRRFADGGFEAAFFEGVNEVRNRQDKAGVAQW